MKNDRFSIYLICCTERDLQRHINIRSFEID